jgi:hypothetical protein
MNEALSSYVYNFLLFSTSFTHRVSVFAKDLANSKYRFFGFGAS